MNLSKALYDRLTGDATFVAMLATYTPPGAPQGRPAFFTSDPVPGDARPPYAVSAGAVAQNALDTKTSQGRDVYRDIRFYVPADRSDKAVEDMAERARFLLHRRGSELVVDGQPAGIVTVTGPRMGAEEQGVRSRVITVRVRTNPV